MPDFLLVSVVIPNFNRAASLGAAIESSLIQQRVEVEVLVCDDGSTDNSEGIVRAIGDPRVRWLPGWHSGGPAVPRNRGIAAASGEWVAFLDSDDTWCDDDKLQVQLAAMSATGSRACSTNAFKAIGAEALPTGRLHSRLPPTITLRDQLKANMVVASSIVVATQLLREVGGFPERSSKRVFEDYALWLRVAQRTPIAAIDRPLVIYRDDIATSHRAQMASELQCTGNALRDFITWRRQQSPPIATSFVESLLMAQQLSRLASVRDAWRRSVASLRRRAAMA